jgi:hypothetical protein
LRAVAFPLGFALLAAACGRPPAAFVGESTHFRLYVDPDLMPLPAAFAGEGALAALETQWADVSTMLHMPDGKITYYWYSADHVGDGCGDIHEGGCMKEGDMEIDAPTLPDAHELNHAYTYLRARRDPIPFLAEGMAEAIGCGAETPARALRDDGWRVGVAALPPSDQVYGQGGLFVRSLIRTYGIDEFLRYYEQSPERRDPALFGANFESFWGMRLDDVWAAANAEPAYGEADEKICPCSLPPLVPGVEPVNDPARAPYWTVPAGADETLAITTPVGQPGSIRHCAGALQGMTGRMMLARFGSSAGWYVPGPLAATAVGRFASDACADAEPYQLPPDFNSSFNWLNVTVPAEAVRTIYLAIDFPSAAKIVGAQEICDSCAFDQGSCQPVGSGTTPSVSGRVYARMQFYASAAELRYGLDSQSLDFYR